MRIHNATTPNLLIMRNRLDKLHVEYARGLMKRLKQGNHEYRPRLYDRLGDQPTLLKPKLFG